ncbi:MAG: hypothetical protein COA50_00850 [Flavobacteriaceae bacterium]|nr:MAG: hypothetical protein COA50_00850 [Flavobacteriaceae bacterium]
MLVLLLKASFVLVILLAFYKILLERESFFTANRIYLLGCLVLMFVLPFVSLPRLVQEQGFVSKTIDKIDFSEPAILPSETILSKNASHESHLEANQNAKGVPDKSGERGIAYWFLLIYYFGVLVLFLNLLTQVVSILLKVIKSTDKVKDTDYTIVNTQLVKEPCSFFRYIFINPALYDFDTYEQILAHEKIHVKKWHTIDLLLSEMVLMLLWFNPFLWMFRKEVEKNLEYQTDDLLVTGASMEKDGYQMNLLKIATFNKPLTITTNYNQSLIKQRILKMSIKKSNPHNYWKYAFIAPVAFMLLLSMNTPVSTSMDNEIEAPLYQNNETQNNLVLEDDCKALLRAVISEDVDSVKEILRATHPDCLYRGDGEPRSPLVAAARLGNLEIGKLLVAANADVEFHDGADESPLMAASANDHFHFTTYLVDNNADINRKVSGDGTALLVAAKRGHLKIVNYLIYKGADVNIQVSADGTPLINSVRSGHYEVSKVLLENGADPYLTSPGDEYPMYHAMMSKNKNLIQLLRGYEKED